MVSILADYKIRTGILCFSVFFYCSIPSFGAPQQHPPDQPTSSDKKVFTSAPVSTSSQPASVISPAKSEKKKAPKEGIKEAHTGPSPGHLPKRKELINPSRPKSKNPINLSTGEELTPWTGAGTSTIPATK